MGFKSDIEIAQECEMLPITQIAEKAGIDDKYLEQYGKYKAKIDWVPSSPNSANNGAACSLACHWQMLYAPVYSQHFLHWHYPTGIKGLRNYLTLNFSFKAPLVLFIISELYNKSDGIIIYFFRFSI